MRLVLTRYRFTPNSTIGRLGVDGVHVCDTLEDTWRPRTAVKVPARTAIPAGEYRVTVTPSPRFGKFLPLLNNVPGFSGVRIHPGNSQDDTEGCILPGTAGTKDNWVSDSKTAYAKVKAMIDAAIEAGQTVTIAVGGEP